MTVKQWRDLCGLWTGGHCQSQDLQVGFQMLAVLSDKDMQGDWRLLHMASNLTVLLRMYFVRKSEGRVCWIAKKVACQIIGVHRR